VAGRGGTDGVGEVVVPPPSLRTHTFASSASARMRVREGEVGDGGRVGGEEGGATPQSRGTPGRVGARRGNKARRGWLHLPTRRLRYHRSGPKQVSLHVCATLLEGSRAGSTMYRGSAKWTCCERRRPAIWRDNHATPGARSAHAKQTP